MVKQKQLHDAFLRKFEFWIFFGAVYTYFEDRLIVNVKDYKLKYLTMTNTDSMVDLKK